MGIGTHYFNNLLDQKLTMGKNDVILAPNGQTSVTITLYSQDIESLHLKKIVSLENILRKVSFRYFYSNSDVSHYSPIELIFHNSNETDWIDIKDIKEEREKQWNVHYDSLRNILLVNYIPMTRIREVEGGNFLVVTTTQPRVITLLISMRTVTIRRLQRRLVTIITHTMPTVIQHW